MCQQGLSMLFYMELCDANLHVILQVMNAALWTNNATEYTRHMRDVSDYIRQQRSGQLPFFIYRDSSVQHFQVGIAPDWNPQMHVA